MNESQILQLPHFITDLSGKGISCYDLQKVWNLPAVALTSGNKNHIGSILCSEKNLPAFQAFFYLEDKDFSNIRRLASRASDQLLRRDLESILYLAGKGPIKLSEVLYKIATYLRAYLLTENVSIFGLPDGSSLTGLMAVMPDGVQDHSAALNYSSMNIAGIAIREKLPYVCANPASDPNYAIATGAPHPECRNLVCFPILSGGVPLGVINASNKWSGDFTDHDLQTLQRFSTVLSHILRAEFETRRSEKFINTSANLGKYLSSPLVRQIATSGTSGELGGVLKKAVVLFADIRSFTTITEGMQATLLVELLNFFFEEMSVIIEKYGGTLDKLVGDMMMVLWNIPVDQPDPELMAMKAAFEMQRQVFRKVAPRWNDMGVKNFGIGIGINSGEAVAGNLGSSRFRNYTVIGNAINKAQRLGAKAKAGEIWIDSDMYSLVEGKIPLPVRKESNIALKGLNVPVTAFVFRG